MDLVQTLNPKALLIAFAGPTGGHVFVKDNVCVRDKRGAINEDVCFQLLLLFTFAQLLVFLGSVTDRQSQRSHQVRPVRPPLSFLQAQKGDWGELTYSAATLTACLWFMHSSTFCDGACFQQTAHLMFDTMLHGTQRHCAVTSWMTGTTASVLLCLASDSISNEQDRHLVPCSQGSPCHAPARLAVSTPKQESDSRAVVVL